MYTVEEAIAMHRETHHSTQANLPDALVHACIELDMALDKKVLYKGMSEVTIHSV